ncbi:hypothetical protein LCGC14_1846830 [marine sediment metagenome]|uniref:Uncharacterized protein n=1 Tax=marine sediment metagenome TaxID=412755 RepID=A0A0F9IR42_9ZZZZ
MGMTSAEIEQDNIKTQAFGRAQVAKGNQIAFDPVKRNESQIKIDAAAKKAYRKGRDDERNKWIRKQEAGAPRLGRPPKYDFSSLKVGGTLFTSETKGRRVYMAARKWAQKNAPSRKFRVRPDGDGTLITRWV